MRSIRSTGGRGWLVEGPLLPRYVGADASLRQLGLQHPNYRRENETYNRCSRPSAKRAECTSAFRRQTILESAAFTSLPKGFTCFQDFAKASFAWGTTLAFVLNEEPGGAVRLPTGGTLKRLHHDSTEGL
jgi:hypothetical protein